MHQKNIVKAIDSLAPLSDAIVDIQALYTQNQDELDIKNLVALIESDAILSVKILKMANSPMYGFSNKINSVSQAVTLFGIMQIYGFILNYAIEENLKANTEIFGYSNEKFNDICNMQSALLMQWYSKIDNSDAKILSPLALIMESGKLAIACEVTSSDYEELYTEGYKKEKNIELFEKEFLGMTSYEICSEIFKHWHLEPLYVTILSELSVETYSTEKVKEYVEILRVIITAVNLKSVLTKESVIKSCKLLTKMGHNIDDFANAALNVKKSYIQELKRREKEIKS